MMKYIAFLCSSKGGINITKLTKLLGKQQTIREAIQSCTQYLSDHQIGEPKENVELLFLYITNWNRATLLLNMLEVFDQKWVEPLAKVIERKAAGEPYQYIIGEQYFYGRKFIVNEHVLIPRPETELLVESVIQQIKACFGERKVNVLDIGTGSGAIALSLKAELPHINVIASDISSQALQTAQQNAAYHQLEVSFVEGDLLTPFVQDNGLKYNNVSIDVVVSNPPYIPYGDKESLQVEVERYEPHLALFGGVDGLTPYKHMLSTIHNLTVKPDIVAFELGIHQSAIIAEQMKQLDAWTSIDIIKDYNNIDRHIVAVKK